MLFWAKVDGLLRRARLPSTGAGETLGMPQSQVKMKLSSCVIVPTMTGEFRSGATKSERWKLKRAEREEQEDSDQESAQRNVLDRCTRLTTVQHS